MPPNADHGGRYYGIFAPGWANDLNVVMSLRQLASESLHYCDRDVALLKHAADRLQALSRIDSPGPGS